MVSLIFFPAQVKVAAGGFRCAKNLDWVA